MIIEEKDLYKIAEDAAVAVSIAEGGAMGSAGQAIVLNADGSVYKTRTVYEEGHVPATKVLERLPSVYGCEVSIMWNGKYYSTPPEERDKWRYFYMGMGNHLFLKPDYYKKHAQEFTEEGDVENYKSWNKIVEAAEKDGK